MQISLTKHEAGMLVDAANRMQCDDLWQEGDQYTEEDFDALISAATKLGGKIGAMEAMALERTQLKAATQKQKQS